MKGFARKAAGLMTALLAVAGVVCVGMRIPAGAGQKAADAAAGFILPAGNADALFHEEDDDTVSSNRKTPSATAPSGAGTPVSPHLPLHSLPLLLRPRLPFPRHKTGKPWS